MDAQVGVEVVLLVEQSVADVTLVRLLAGVGTHVRLQVVRLYKLFATVRAVKRFRRGVHQRVASEFLLILEGTRAEGTFEGILEDMGFHVGFKIVGLGKGFQADFTLVWLNLVVLLHMIVEFFVVQEYLITNGANVRFSVRVAYSYVIGQFRWMMEFDPAALTDQRMSAHMCGKIVLLVKTFFADGTRVRSFICVRPNMCLQIVRLAKMLTANVTFIWFLSRVHFHVRGQIIRLDKTFSTNSTCIRFLRAVLA